MSEQIDTTALELRRLTLEERRIENERRATRTPEEAAFDVAIRQATTLADSPVLFYDEARVKDVFSGDRAAYRNERIAFATQLLAFAAAMQVPVALLAGQAHIVKGRVGFATSFLIGLVNARAQLKSPLDWTVEGSGPSLAVTCSATDALGVVREVTITMEQARAWGWGSTGPWKADPALMLRYRTAAQLIRLYFSAAVFGLPLVTTEELRDVIDGDSEPARAARPAPPQLPEPAPDLEPPVLTEILQTQAK